MSGDNDLSARRTRPAVNSLLAKVELGDRSNTGPRVITAADVLRFAELSGDFEKIHVDEAYARTTPYGRCIVHGLLLLAQMGNGLLAEARVGRNVSYGYDRVRFICPIFVGDTVTVTGEIIEKRAERSEVIVEERLFNSGGEVAVVAHHIYKFI